MRKDPKKPHQDIEDKLIKAKESTEEPPKEPREIIEDPEIKKETIDLDTTYIFMREDI